MDLSWYIARPPLLGHSGRASPLPSRSLPNSSVIGAYGEILDQLALRRRREEDERVALVLHCTRPAHSLSQGIILGDAVLEACTLFNSLVI